LIVVGIAVAAMSGIGLAGVGGIFFLIESPAEIGFGTGAIYGMFGGGALAGAGGVLVAIGS